MNKGYSLMPNDETIFKPISTDDKPIREEEYLEVLKTKLSNLYKKGVPLEIGDCLRYAFSWETTISKPEWLPKYFQIKEFKIDRRFNMPMYIMKGDWYYPIMLEPKYDNYIRYPDQQLNIENEITIGQQTFVDKEEPHITIVSKENILKELKTLRDNYNNNIKESEDIFKPTTPDESAARRTELAIKEKKIAEDLVCKDNTSIDVGNYFISTIYKAPTRKGESPTEIHAIHYAPIKYLYIAGFVTDLTFMYFPADNTYSNAELAARASYNTSQWKYEVLISLSNPAAFKYVHVKYEVVSPEQALKEIETYKSKGTDRHNKPLEEAKSIFQPVSKKEIPIRNKEYYQKQKEKLIQVIGFEPSKGDFILHKPDIDRLTSVYQITDTDFDANNPPNEYDKQLSIIFREVGYSNKPKVIQFTEPMDIHNKYSGWAAWRSSGWSTTAVLRSIEDLIPEYQPKFIKHDDLKKEYQLLPLKESVDESTDIFKAATDHDILKRNMQYYNKLNDAAIANRKDVEKRLGIDALKPGDTIKVKYQKEWLTNEPPITRTFNVEAIQTKLNMYDTENWDNNEVPSLIIYLDGGMQKNFESFDIWLIDPNISMVIIRDGKVISNKHPEADLKWINEAKSIFKPASAKDKKTRQYEYDQLIKDKLKELLGEFPKVGDYYIDKLGYSEAAKYRLNIITLLYPDGLDYTYEQYSIMTGNRSALNYLLEGNKNWETLLRYKQDGIIPYYFKVSEKDLMLKQLEGLYPGFDSKNYVVLGPIGAI